MASLMLHRDVLTNFGRLAKVQKRVSELIRKFEEDSTQSSIHLERIEQAIDGKVRSARVGDDWRAMFTHEIRLRKSIARRQERER